MFTVNKRTTSTNTTGLQERANSVTISNMKWRIFGRNQRGEVNVLVIPLILTVLMLLGAIGFGAWSYSSREDYRLHVVQKVSTAVKAAKQEEGIAKDKEHAEADKQPLKPYNGPDQYGSVKILFPKTWSGYVIDSGTTVNQPLNGYFHPGVVPNVNDKAAALALRVQVINQSYAKVIEGMDGEVEDKKVTATPYAFPNVPKIVGTRFDGAIIDNKNIKGAMVVVPLRDKTLQVWTESPIYLNDFNTLILPNVSFSP